eukprot:gene23170-30379_t
MLMKAGANRDASGNLDRHKKILTTKFKNAAAFCIAPWASAVSGIIVGVLYVGSSKLALYLRIDDPLDSGSIHYISGVVGTLLNAALAKPQYVKELTGSSCGGFIYDTDSGGMQLGVQLLGVVAISAWVIFFSVILFGALRYYNLLRVDQTTELAGIDNIEHGGPACPEFNRVRTARNPEFYRVRTASIPRVQQGRHAVRKLSQAAVKKLPQAAVRKLSQAAVKKLPQAAVRKLSQAAVKKLPQVAVRKLSQAAVKKLP